MKFIDEIGMATTWISKPVGKVNVAILEDSAALIYLFLLHSFQNMSNP